MQHNTISSSWENLPDVCLYNLLCSGRCPMPVEVSRAFIQAKNFDVLPGIEKHREKVARAEELEKTLARRKAYKNAVEVLNRAIQTSDMKSFQNAADGYLIVIVPITKDVDRDTLKDLFILYAVVTGMSPSHECAKETVFADVRGNECLFIINNIGDDSDECTDEDFDEEEARLL